MLNDVYVKQESCTIVEYKISSIERYGQDMVKSVGKMSEAKAKARRKAVWFFFTARPSATIERVVHEYE